MRNWNHIASRYSAGPCPRFYSTYEELKLNKVFWQSLFTHSFYSTYEELKQAKIWYYYLRINSFYSTYEELKRPPVQHKNRTKKQFLQYLWGIETG